MWCLPEQVLGSTWRVWRADGSLLVWLFPNGFLGVSGPEAKGDVPVDGAILLLRAAGLV